MMKIELLRTQNAIESCRNHLSENDLFGTDIEFYLSQYIIIIFHAELHNAFKKLVEESVKRVRNVRIKNYVKNTSERIFRRISKGDLSAFLKHFGNGAVKKLNESLDDYDTTIFNNAITNRHLIAHQLGPQITLNDIDKLLPVAYKFLTVFSVAITKK